jgi:hypothetical protein
MGTVGEGCPCAWLGNVTRCPPSFHPWWRCSSAPPVLIGMITDREFILGLSAMDPDVPHAPPFLRVRLFYIFRLYDSNNGGGLTCLTPRGTLSHVHASGRGAPVASPVRSRTQRFSAYLNSPAAAPPPPPPFHAHTHAPPTPPLPTTASPQTTAWRGMSSRPWCGTS